MAGDKFSFSNWNDLTPAQMTSLFLYGTLTPPQNFEERLRSSAEKDNLSNAPIVVEFDAVDFMANGPGRYAHASQSEFVDAFFTTKAEGEGTGLGMSMAYGFIKQCHGHIHVYSEIGHGTCFRIYLPRMDVVPGDATAAVPSVAGGRETILVAEDDDDARELAVAMLERLGYKILQARNGRIALDMLQMEQGRIDLVFTDLVMSGGVSGTELMEAARPHRPDIKVLYASGYTENAIPRYQLGTGEEFISKPYRREVLAAKLRRILDEKNA